jgi:anti-sigma factor RsiW
MSDDTWCFELDQYLDSELTAENMRQMDAHLGQCASCAGDALHRLQLKRATCAAGKRYKPSAEFRLHIEKQVARKHRDRSWAWIPALSLATVLLIAAVVGIGRWYEGTRSQQLLAELADIHVADLASQTPVDVVSSERHTVKPWFQGKLPFTFDLPELQRTPFTLLGGRVAYLQHEPGAHLLYKVGAHNISVFIFRDSPEIDLVFPGRDSSRRVLSFHVESWSSDGLRYFVFSDSSPEAIQELSRLLKQAGA